MKKLIYSLAIALMGITGCTSFDEEQSVKYGDGPAVSISLTTTTDSTFTFTVSPAEGTEYYSYVVVSGKADESVSESSVLKATLSGAIQSSIVEYAKSASTTVNMRDAKGQPLCSPNTDYVVYAIAQDYNGMTGKVASLEVTTSDGEVPVLNEYEAKDPTDANDTITTVSFSEAVALGEGTVSAAYFQEWGDGKLIAIPEEDLTVDVNGNKVSFAVQHVPNGAYVLYSWTEGAFVDSFGNKCPATVSQLTEEGIAGVYRRLPLQSWAITAEDFTQEAGMLIADYKTFQGTMTFDHDIFRNEELVEDGDISVVYTGSKKSSTIALATDEWSVSGKTLTFTLPEVAAAGDVITVKVKADVIFDINGNGNEAFASSEKTMWWSYFGAPVFTKQTLLGDKDALYYSARSKGYVNSSLTIEDYPASADTLIITNFMSEYCEITLACNYVTGKFYAEVGDVVGVYTAKDGTGYYVLTYSQTGNADIEFVADPSGALVSDDMGLVLYNPATKQITGWYDYFPIFQIDLGTSSSASTRSVKVTKIDKPLRSASVKKVNINSQKTLRK